MAVALRVARAAWVSVAGDGNMAGRVPRISRATASGRSGRNGLGCMAVPGWVGMEGRMWRLATVTSMVIGGAHCPLWNSPALRRAAALGF